MFISYWLKKKQTTPFDKQMVRGGNSTLNFADRKMMQERVHDQYIVTLGSGFKFCGCSNLEFDFL